LYYLGKKDDRFRIECEKCGKVLLFDKKYFIETDKDDVCQSNTPLQCSCGNITNGIIKSKKPNEKSEYDKSNSHLTHCPHCGSTNIQLVKRRWSFWTGLLTNKVDRYCVNCKTKF